MALRKTEGEERKEREGFFMGVKIGLEIHQRLDTRKLHCFCYANPSEEKGGFKADLVLKRHLKAVGGELGDVDVAPAFQARNKNLLQ